MFRRNECIRLIHQIRRLIDVIYRLIEVDVKKWPVLGARDVREVVDGIVDDGM